MSFVWAGVRYAWQLPAGDLGPAQRRLTLIGQRGNSVSRTELVPGGQVRHTPGRITVVRSQTPPTAFRSAVLPPRARRRRRRRLLREGDTVQGETISPGALGLTNSSDTFLRAGQFQAAKRISFPPSCPDTHTQLGPLMCLDTAASTYQRSTLSEGHVVLQHGRDQRAFHCKDKVLAKRILTLRPNSHRVSL